MSPSNLPAPLPLISFETIMREALPPIDWLVEALIARGDRVILYGEFGSLKSWLLLDLGLHIAAGRPWLGHFPIPQSRRVLYIDEEMNQRTLRRRIKRLGIGAGLEDEAIPFRAMSRVGVRFGTLGAKLLLQALEKRKFDPEIVIIEAFRRVLVGSENEARDVAEFWRCVESIPRAGKTLIISHHMRKPNALGNNANRDRASGSTDILAGADVALAIQRLGGDSVAVECVKSREAEEPSAFVVSLYDEGADSAVEMRYEAAQKEFQAQGSKVEQAMPLVEAFLRASPSHPAERSAILAHLKVNQITERTGERTLQEMKRRGRILNVGHGLWQLVTKPQAA